MKNVNEVQVLAIMDKIYSIIRDEDKLPHGFYIDRDEILSEIFLDLQYLDKLYVEGPASFRTYAINYSPKRVVAKIWKQYKKIEKFTVIDDELNDDGTCNHVYGKYQTKSLTTEPDYEKIVVDDILEGLDDDDRKVVQLIREGAANREISRKLEISEMQAHRKIEKICEKIRKMA